MTDATKAATGHNQPATRKDYPMNTIRASGLPKLDSNDYAVRQSIESSIASAFVAEYLGASEHHAISVNDGESTVLVKSRDPLAISRAMFSTDGDNLVCFKSQHPGVVKFGTVSLVYGNTGYDVISDYSESLSPYMKLADALSAIYEGAVM